MKIYGLTGGIGSGKTTVGQVFKTLGIAIYNADERAKWLTENNNTIKLKIKSIFGEQLYDLNDVLDKKILSEIVFNNKIELKKLNEIIHPEVRLDFTEWIKKQKGNYVLKESAILFENGLEKEVDGVVGVIATEEIRIKRVVARSHLSPLEIRARMNNQINQDILKDKCNWVIYNNEHDLVIPQVLKLHEVLNVS